ncbi:hypothetical protein BS78_05G264000 [Paspalum vaginatum]|nr:hypothetical protein BS78_05G264000 [Paspalum vaginatum]
MDDPAAASWGPCEFQLANWTAEEQAAADDVWAPVGLPVPVGHYWPIDIFDSCSIQACVPGSRGAEQLSRQEVIKKNSGKQMSGEPTKVIVTNDRGMDARGVFKQVGREFKDDMELIEEKVHKYPAVLGALDGSYTVPKVVAIGPYRHDKPHLKKAEKVKHMAAIQCVRESRRSLEEVYAAVVSVAVEEAWSLYDKDMMRVKGIECGDDFWHMMFFDACFLVQYILMQTESSDVDQSLCDFFGPNRKDIFQDITMFENYNPRRLRVLQKVLEFLPVTQDPILEFINLYRDYLHDQLIEYGNSPRLEFDKDYKAPHLLGLLRHYTVGKISDGDLNTTKDIGTPSISISARELAEIGITLRANLKSTDLVRNGLRQEGALGAELSLVPVTLGHNPLELHTVTSFKSSPFQDSAVFSYLQLLAMLVHREDDVQELRAKGVLQGGGGLTNQQALSFFTSLQGQRRGRLYRRIMQEIEGYKENRWIWIKFYAFLLFVRRYWGVIAGVVSAIGAFVGIIVALLSLRKDF